MGFIRPFEQGDTNAVMDLWHDVAVHDQAFVPKAFWDEMKEVVRTQYLPASRTWVFVDEDGVVAGFVSLLGDLVGALFVRRESQSRGIGAMLVEKAAEAQRPLFVEVYEKNARARAFYRRCGFAEVARFVQNETGESIVRKRLAL